MKIVFQWEILTKMTIEKDLGNKLLYCIYNRSESEIEEWRERYFNHVSELKDKYDKDLFNRVEDRMRNYYKEKMREEEGRISSPRWSVSNPK